MCEKEGGGAVLEGRGWGDVGQGSAEPALLLCGWLIGGVGRVAEGVARGGPQLLPP